MGLILLEALGAGIALVLIVWWTMFSGRKGGELHDVHGTDEAAPGTPSRPPAEPPPRD